MGVPQGDQSDCSIQTSYDLIMGYRGSRLTRRKYCQRKFFVKFPIKYHFLSSLSHLHEAIQTIDLGSWCLLPLANEKVQVCKFSNKGCLPEIAISVVITPDSNWTVQVPTLTEVALCPFILDKLPTTIETPESVHNIIQTLDNCRQCAGNEADKYAKVTSAHNGIFKNAQGWLPV